MVTFAKVTSALLLMVGAASAGAASHTVNVGGVSSDPYGGDAATLAFTPDSLTIAVGDTVTFHNVGGHHNVHADDDSFRCAQGCDAAGGNGAPSDDAWSSTVTFAHAGVVAYHCDVHESMGMTGTIVVQGTGPAGNVPITNGFTGSWINAAGQIGLGIEVLSGGNLIAEGYTYAPDGGLVYVGGVGPIVDGDHAVVSVGYREGAGGRFPPNYDDSQLTYVPWGTLTFTFTDCNNGTLAWSSPLAGYGVGSMTITRLTQPAGLVCP